MHTNELAKLPFFQQLISAAARWLNYALIDLQKFLCCSKSLASQGNDKHKQAHTNYSQAGVISHASTALLTETGNEFSHCFVLDRFILSFINVEDANNARASFGSTLVLALRKTRVLDQH